MVRATNAAALAAMLLACARTSGAQQEASSPLSCAPTTAAIARPCELDRWEGLLHAPPPRYPDILRSAYFDGDTRVRYVVDSTGVVKLSSLVVADSGHALFVFAVRMALASRTFAPPRRLGRPVPVQLEETFRFHYAAWAKEGNSATGPDEIPAVVDRDSAGVRRTTLGGSTMDTTPIPAPTDPETLLRIRRLAARQAFDNYRARTDSADVLCVQLSGGSPDPETLRLLTVPGWRAVGPEDCRRTHAGMIARVPSASAKAQKDPLWLMLGEFERWTRGGVIVRVDVGRGGRTDQVRCAVLRVDGQYSQARCAAFGSTFGVSSH